MKKLNDTIVRISNAVSNTQIQSWKHIEVLIRAESELFKLELENIRKRLKRL